MINSDHLREPSTFRRKVKRGVNRLLFRYNEIVPKRKMPFDGIFVIGTYKTGTTSMHHYFSSIGLRHLTINTEVKRRYANNDWEYLNFLVSRYHSFDDNPWHRLDVVEHFMRQQRDFRFILTVRDQETWFRSFVAHNLRHGYQPPLKEEKSAFTKKMLIDHNSACRKMALRYNKPLLEIELASEPEPEQRILSFVGLPDRGVQFPHSNRAQR